MNRKLEHDWFDEPLPQNVDLGERNWLYSSFAFRHYRSKRPWGLKSGHDTGLYNGTFFNLGPTGEVVIGNYCALVGAIICCNGRVEIGDYAFIAHEVVLADSFTAVPFFSDDEVSEPETSISIAENVWIGARAVLLKGTQLGKGSIVGAGTVVDFEVPAYSIVAGNPARVVGEVQRQ
jgi:acetyltransferase-like isoleucine patch superfamily enzyme